MFGHSSVITTARGKQLAAGTRLTLFSADKPDRLFTVVTFLMDKVSGVLLDLGTGVPCYQVEDEESRIHLLFQLPIGEANENRCSRNDLRGPPHRR